MISRRLKTWINLVLIGAVVVDLVLSTTCLFFPETWFRVFHGAPYIDPQALLRRTGAVWAAFTLLQLIALVRWKKDPWWLVLVAGVRLTELFSDWTYLYMAQSVTSQGRVGLFIAPPSNLVMGWFFINAYLKIMKDKYGPGAA